MKNYIILSFAFAILLTGCSKIEQDTIETGDCLVSFNLTGEISTEDTPLTRSSTDDIYLVQVYRGSSPFALGIFDSISDIRFNLKKGGDTYKFKICLIKNGKTQLSTISFYQNYYYYRNDVNALAIGANKNNVFSCDYAYSNTRVYFPINQCYYNSVGTFTYYDKASNTLSRTNNCTWAELGRISDGIINNKKYWHCDSMLYGEINDYSPTGEYETLNMDLKRVGFKLKYEVSGITDGKVMLYIYNNDMTFVKDTLSAEGGPYSIEPRFYTYYDLHSAWQYADGYMENFTLAVSWLRGVGVTEDYGTKTIQLKRNCLNNVRISMTSNDQTAGMNLDVESEDSIGSDQYVIPVQ